MSGTMSLADLVADLKASLQDCATVFDAANDADFVRHLWFAAEDFNRVAPLVVDATLTLSAGIAAYAVPANCEGFHSHSWSNDAQPWDTAYPGKLPRGVLRVVGGAVKLLLVPPPSARQIALLGTEFRYCYYATHALGAAAADTTIRPGQRGLLILRAQAEAMKEMAMRNVKKPVQMRDGISSVARNGTPAYLYELLMTEFNERAA